MVENFENAGFESGDLTSWSYSGGDVYATTDTPYSGSYRCNLGTNRWNSVVYVSQSVDLTGVTNIQCYFRVYSGTANLKMYVGSTQIFSQNISSTSYAEYTSSAISYSGYQTVKFEVNETGGGYVTGFLDSCTTAVIMTYVSKTITGNYLINQLKDLIGVYTIAGFIEKTITNPYRIIAGKSITALYDIAHHLKELTSSYEIIAPRVVNGDFELGDLSHWWTGYYGGYSITTSPVHEGTYSCALTLENNHTIQMLNDTALPHDKDRFLQIYLYSSSSNPSLNSQFSVSLLTTSNPYTASYYTVFNDNNGFSWDGWRLFYAPVLASVAATYPYLYIYMYTNNYGGTYYYFNIDDIELIDGIRKTIISPYRINASIDLTSSYDIRANFKELTAKYNIDTYPTLTGSYFIPCGVSMTANWMMNINSAITGVYDIGHPYNSEFVVVID
jgi:hypothetical protein